MARCITRRMATDPETNRLHYVQCRKHAHVLIEGRYPFCLQHAGAMLAYRRLLIVGDCELQFVPGPDRKLHLETKAIGSDYPEFNPEVLTNGDLPPCPQPS